VHAVVHEPCIRTVPHPCRCRRRRRQTTRRTAIVRDFRLAVAQRSVSVSGPPSSHVTRADGASCTLFTAGEQRTNGAVINQAWPASTPPRTNRPTDRPGANVVPVDADVLHRSSMQSVGGCLAARYGTPVMPEWALLFPERYYTTISALAECVRHHGRRVCVCACVCGLERRARESIVVLCKWSSAAQTACIYIFLSKDAKNSVNARHSAIYGPSQLVN